METSREMLWRLIAERATARADRPAIDARIRELFEEDWTVVFTDLVGFSKRTTEFGIIHFLTLIYQKEQLLSARIEQYGGRFLKREADSWLLLFRHPVAAVDALLECQQVCAQHNRGLPKHERVELCVGIGHGPVLRIGDEDVWGREVNVASRLGEDVARGGDTLVTDTVRRLVGSERPRLAFAEIEVPRLEDRVWRVESASEPT